AMSAERGRPLGSLTVFSREDFEDDWVRVASGGFGHVYQVKHRRWRTVYAVKCSPFLLQDSSVDRTSMNCLMEEASKMEKIKFQHIVTIYGVCNSPLGIVMEYMARGSLERILPTHRMSWQLKFRVIHEMGLAMNFLHSMSPPLLHLDLKPGNVLLDGNMHVKISDFGLSRWMEQSSRMQYIESSALRGTLSYIPPEMFLQNSKPPGIKYDVYSFGIVIWEVLMQKKPYAGANMMAIIVKVAAGKRPGLELVRDDWPGECHQMLDLMKRCWDQDPKQRPSFADIPVETDVLLALIQSLVQDPENERLVRKMSHKPALSRSQQDVPSPLPHGEAGPPEDVPPEEPGGAQENGPTLLHLMVMQGNVGKARFLLGCGAGVNSAAGGGCTPLLLARDGWTPLHLAAQNNFENVARVLLSRQADPNAQEVDGKTALHVAACFGHVGLVKLLASPGAELERKQKNLRARPDARGAMDWTPLHLATRYGDEAVVGELLRCGADPNAAERAHWAPLHFAVLRGSFLSVINLLESRADVNARNKVGWTPLHLAVLKGNLAIIKTLLKAGAQLDVEDITGCTALQLAVRHQRESVIALLQGKEPSGGKPGSRTLNDAKV
ncbi:ANKK1 protein, partial [Aegithalos caudatus]|nr:ANKK1 protein [Aegithalos caudatus]